EPDVLGHPSGRLLQGQPHVIVSSRQQKGQWVLRLEGIDSRDQSEELRDELLYIPEGDLHPLPPGQYYRFQMLGLRVYTVGGVCLGQISEVLATGSNDVYVVTGAGGELLIPATTDVIQEVNLEGGRVVVDLPEASS
ncbi:MAG: ribosome maturation factor RimM, partial [Dehalococcoidia bacterium]